MALAQESKSAAVRARLDHPVIDADGHTVEFEPALLDHLKAVSGPDMVQRYLNMRQHGGATAWYRLSPEERTDFRDFVFRNPSTLYAGTNPDFFKGTVVEDAVNALMATETNTVNPQ